MMNNTHGDYETACPNCGAEELFITSLTLTYQEGKQLTDLHAPLHEDGFDFWDKLSTRQREQDCSTEDETVICDSCQTEFSLSELMLSDARTYVIQVSATVRGKESVEAGSERVACMKALLEAHEGGGVGDYDLSDERTEVLKVYITTKKGQDTHV